MEKQLDNLKLSTDYLPILEKLLLNNKINNELTIKSILSDLFATDTKTDFIKFIFKQLESKHIYFIRHAQAQHNHFNIYQRSQGIEEPDFYDPELTKEGIEQCKALSENINKLDRVIQLIFVSPLRRTLQTYTQVEAILNTDKNKVIVTDLIREKLKMPKSHRGHLVEKLKEEFKQEHLDYGYINKKIWWSQFEDEEYDHINHSSEKESTDNCEWRVAMALIWLILKQEKNVCMISHSGIYTILLLKTLAKNKPKCKHSGLYKLDNKIIKLFLETLFAKI
jgi:broad specificity phosphatase PhoE